MFEKLCYNDNNERILCEMNGKHNDMLMNIKVKKFDINDIKSVHLNLLDSQVDLILNAL